MKDGDGIGFVGTVRDITERKRLEEASGAEKEGLKMHKGESLFLSNMSHEIRTPRTAILGFAGLLGIRVEPAAKRICRCDRRVAPLLLVYQMKTRFSKLNRTSLSWKRAPFDLAPCVRTNEAIAASAAQKELYLDVEVDQKIPSFIYGDEGRFRQILIISSQRHKVHNNSGVKVFCRKAALHRGNRLRKVSVKDTGGWNSKEIREAVRAFLSGIVRHDEKAMGTGLGLTICQEAFVSSWEGNSFFESGEGTGQTCGFCRVLALKSTDERELGWTRQTLLRRGSRRRPITRWLAQAKP